VPSNIVV
jgi:hypothetical protein